MNLEKVVFCLASVVMILALVVLILVAVMSGYPLRAVPWLAFYLLQLFLVGTLGNELGVIASLVILALIGLSPVVVVVALIRRMQQALKRRRPAGPGDKAGQQSQPGENRSRRQRR